MQMTYTEVAAPPDLGNWVASFWSFSVDPAAGEITHTIPLTGGAMLSLSNGELFLLGPRILPLIVTVRGGEIHRGVHFLPGAATSLFGVAGERWRDIQVPARLELDAAWCDRLIGDYSSDDDFYAAAIEALRSVAEPARHLDAAVAAAVARLIHSNGTESIADLSRAIDLSPRQLRRRFASCVGLTPKELARILRVRAAAVAAAKRDDSWVGIVAEHGFADQPHLVREFRSVLGATPTRFAAHARKIAHHGKSFE